MADEDLTEEQAIEAVVAQMDENESDPLNEKPADDKQEDREPEGASDEPEDDEQEGGEPEGDESEGGESESEDEDDQQNDEAEAEGEESDDIQSVSDLAEALDVPEEELTDKLKYKFKAGGEEVELTLGQLSKDYQNYVGLRKQQDSIVSEGKELREMRTTKMQEFEQSAQVHASALNATEQLVGMELQTPEMQELYRDDYEQFAKKEREVSARLNWIRQQRESASADYQEKVLAARTEQAKEGHAAMLKAHSDFEEKRPEYAKKIYSALEPLGFSQQEIDQTTDHRLLLGALKLWEAEQQLQSREVVDKATKATAKKVKKTIPKLAGKGKPTGIRRSKITKLRESYNKNPTDEKAIALIADRL